MKVLTKVVVNLLIVLAVAAGVYYLYVRSTKASAVSFRTAPVKSGDLVSTINATGTVEPEELVDVGAQVAGQIVAFGTDANGKPVDYRSPVVANMVLARIDDALCQADVDSAKAALAVAKAAVVGAQTNLDGARAGVTKAEADLGTKKATCDQAGADWERAQKLGSGEALAETQYDAYKYGFAIAKANVALDEAAVTQARATVEQTQAALLQAQSNVQQQQAALDKAVKNLNYCTITSPVDGVIIDRRVNIGETVVSSLSSPSLFLIAKDLRRMQIWVSVNEADVGNIYPGQPVSFKVDAFPGDIFTGAVGKVRFNATMTSNVVTYTVEVITDNSSGRLLPYLTANVDFELARVSDVLTVPNAALRWTPHPEQVDPAYRDVVAQARPRRGAGGEQSATTQAATSPARTTRPTSRPATRPGRSSGREGPRSGFVWVEDGKFVRPIKVRIGITDGINTEVSGQDLEEGARVIIGEQLQSVAGGQAANPFLPQMRRPSGQGGGGGSGGGAGGGGAGGGTGGPAR